jgi:hypothetical protein
MLDREDYDRWVRNYLRPRYPKLVARYLAALDGYERITGSNQADTGSLMAIELGASSSHAPLAAGSVEFLSDLVPKFPEACETLSRMFKSRLWHVRFNALRCLSSDTLPAFVTPMLHQGLHDKSHRVRNLAAYKIEQLRIIELIPDLKMCLGNESDDETKSAMEFYLRLLRDGYCIRREANNMHFIWISTKDYIIGHQITLREFPAIISAFLRKRKTEKAG